MCPGNKRLSRTTNCRCSPPRADHGGDDAGADLLLALVDEALEVLEVDAIDGTREQLHVPDRANAVVRPAAAAHGELLPGLAEIALEALPLLEHLRQARVDLADRHLEELGEIFLPAAFLRQMPPRGMAGHRLDAAHPGRNRALGHDAHQPDVAGAPDVGAAAQLDRPAERIAGVAHGDDADFLAVFLPEQRPRAVGDR